MTPGARMELEEERDFLLRSLEDLEGERAAGDLADDDYEILRARYTVRAAAVLRALDAHGQTAVIGEVTDATATPVASEAVAPRGSRPRRRRRKAYVWGALALFAAAVVVLLVAELATRLPGQTGSGAVQLSSAQQIQRTLSQAAVLETEGNASQALVLYEQVLRQDPTQEQALAESNWLEYEAGVDARNSSVLSRAQRGEEAAEAADPGAYAPHLYLGSMLLVERQATAASDEFARFLADNPPTVVAQRAWPYVVRAYSAAGRPAPVPPPGVKG